MPLSGRRSSFFNDLYQKKSEVKKWRPIAVTGFERRQLEQVRKDLDEEYEKANGPLSSPKTEARPSRIIQHFYDFTPLLRWSFSIPTAHSAWRPQCLRAIS